MKRTNLFNQMYKPVLHIVCYTTRENETSLQKKNKKRKFMYVMTRNFEIGLIVGTKNFDLKARFVKSTCIFVISCSFIIPTLRSYCFFYIAISFTFFFLHCNFVYVFFLHCNSVYVFFLFLFFFVCVTRGRGRF